MPSLRSALGAFRLAGDSPQSLWLAVVHHGNVLGAYWGPLVPVARRNDPHTSWAAAGSVVELRTKQESVYFCLLVIGPATDYRIASEYHRRDFPHQSPSGLRTRRAELVELGLVRDTGKREVLPTNRQGIVWEAIPGRRISPA